MSVSEASVVAAPAMVPEPAGRPRPVAKVPRDEVAEELPADRGARADGRGELEPGRRAEIHGGLRDLEAVVDPDAARLSWSSRRHLAGGEELNVGPVHHVVADGRAAGEPLARAPVAGEAAGEAVGGLVGQLGEELRRR